MASFEKFVESWENLYLEEGRKFTGKQLDSIDECRNAVEQIHENKSGLNRQTLLDVSDFALHQFEDSVDNIDFTDATPLLKSVLKAAQNHLDIPKEAMIGIVKNIFERQAFKNQELDIRDVLSDVLDVKDKKESIENPSKIESSHPVTVSDNNPFIKRAKDSINYAKTTIEPILEEGETLNNLFDEEKAVAEAKEKKEKQSAELSKEHAEDKNNEKPSISEIDEIRATLRKSGATIFQKLITIIKPLHQRENNKIQNQFLYRKLNNGATAGFISCDSVSISVRHRCRSIFFVNFNNRYYR